MSFEDEVNIKKKPVYFGERSKTAGPRQHLKAAFLDFISVFLDPRLPLNQHPDIFV